MTTSSIIAEYYRRHREELVVYATKQLEGDRMTAEDLVQTVFLRLFTNKLLITPITLQALVYTTLRHLLCDLWRHRQQQQRFLSQYKLYAEGHANDTHSLCSAHQLTDLLERRMKRLNEQTTKVMRLSIVEECPVSEIADILNINYKKAENCLQAGRKLLRPYARKLMAG